MSARADEIRNAVRQHMRHQKSVESIVKRWSKEMNVAAKVCKTEEEKDILRKDYLYAIFNILFSLMGEPKSEEDVEALFLFFEQYLSVITGKKVTIEIH